MAAKVASYSEEAVARCARCPHSVSMMALAAANSPRNQARMASLAKESETRSGGGTIAGGSVRDTGTAAMGRGIWFNAK